MAAQAAEPVTDPQAPYPRSPVITGLKWDDSVYKLKTKAGDNWPITWVEDDLQITAWGDGPGFDEQPPRLSLGFARIRGNPPDLQAEDFSSSADTPEGGGSTGIKASGLLFVDSVLYTWVRNYRPPGSDDFTNARLAWSKDRGAKWTWAEWHFSDTFGCPEFVQFGPNYAGARDVYVYVVSQANDSAYGYSPDIVMARVPKNGVADRDLYEFFSGLDNAGQPRWTKDLSRRKPIFTDPHGTQRIAITYNAGFKRYLLTTSHRPTGNNATHTPALGVFDAPEPWGPWTTVSYDSHWSGTNRTYHHKFPTRWMSSDGRTVWLLYSGLDGGLYTFCLKKATLQTALDSIKSLPPHPRLLLNQDGLPAVRERAAGPDRAYFQTLKTQADEWLSREVKLPSRGGQWFHWYSCPKHGARLRTEGPTRHVCPVDQEVFTGYPYDDVVLSTEHNRLAGAIRTLGLVYQIGGDSRHAAKAKEILLAYAGKYQSYPLHDIRGQARVGGGKVGPQTLDEATWLITVVEGADCIWDTLTTDQQREIKEGLLIPATDVIRQHKMGIHNIQCWKNSAVGLTGLLLGEMSLVEEALNGPAGYYSQMAKGVSVDGPWFEGAWGYHFYTLNALLHLTEGAFQSGLNLYGPELKRMFDAPLAMAMPDLSLPAFNDSGTVDLSGNASLYQTAFARYRDPQYLVVTARSRRGNESALLHGNEEHGPAPIFEPVSRNFVASGNAILAAGSGSSATWLCMKYGPHGGGHGHPDKLNFVLYGLGQVIAPDPGTANYGVPIQAGWFRTTLAHNTLSMDEKSQQPAEGTCEAFVATNGFSAVMAQAGNIYDGVRFRRTLALIGTDLLVAIDQIQSERAHVYDLAYHNRGRLDADGGRDFQPADKPGYSLLRNMRASISSSPVRLGFELETRKPVWWALAGGEPTTILTGTGVGKHTEDRVPLVIARRDAKATTYLWCIYLGSNGDRLDVQPEEVSVSDRFIPDQTSAAAVRVNVGSETHLVVANPGGKSVMVRNQKVEGRIGWLTQADTGLLQVNQGQIIQSRIQPKGLDQ